MIPTAAIALPPRMSDPDLRPVFAALQAAGDPSPSVLFVGGCVRDALLGRPADDVDLATVHPPDIVAARLAAAGIKTLEVGAAYGTVAARFGHKLFQITTLRRDIEAFGRRARVAYTDDWAADAARRDFTMNALYADPQGNVYDPLGGRGDAEARRIRFIGDAAERIGEDALRILRFFRFHAQLGERDLDAGGLAACRMRAGDLANLSGERIREELFKLLAAADPVPTVRLMMANGIAQPILPELSGPDRLAGLVTAESAAGSADHLRRLAALIASPDGAARVGGRLRLSNRDAARLRAMASGPGALDPGMPASGRKARLYALGPDAWRDAVLLNWADEIAAGSVDGSGRAGAWLALLGLPEDWSVPEFPLRGADATDAGVPAGPDVGRALEDLENWWIAGGFEADRKACLAELKRRARAG